MDLPGLPDGDNEGHAHEAGELDELETIRSALGAPGARLYFFDRGAFSPRLRQLGEERDDVELVPLLRLDPTKNVNG